MSLYKQFKTDKNVEKEGIVLNYGKTARAKILRFVLPVQVAPT